MVPNGVGTGKPPAKALPPGAVWQSLQLPMVARSRPRLTSAGSKDCGAGGSIAPIAGRQATAKAVIATPVIAVIATPAMIRTLVICPKLLLLWAGLLAQIAGPRPKFAPGSGRRQAQHPWSGRLFYCFISGAASAAENALSNAARSALGRSPTAT